MAYEEAQEFLARVVPWPAQTDPPEFFVNIHYPWQPPNGGKKVYPGRAARTLKEAINFIQWKASQNVDLYVCMAAVLRAKPKTGKNGRDYWGAIRRDPVWHRSFYIDVDTKPGGFATTQIAADAFGQFLQKTDLPFPTFIVPSGSGGFHVHWVLDEPVTTAVWMPVALGLVGAMRHHGFEVEDKGCTTDAIRLLRVPNTFNYKHDPPRPVTLAHSGDIYSLDRIASRVLQYAGVTPPRAVKTRPSTKINDTLIRQVSGVSALVPFTELMANQQESLPSLAEVRKVCPFVEHAHVSGGRDYRQPLWWETAKIAFYLREGEAALHTMARAHADYRPDENHELYERIVRERTPVDNYGWPQCDTIMAQGSPDCAGCQWMKDGTAHGHSPFNFLSGSAPTPVIAAAVTVPVTTNLPTGYTLDPVTELIHLEKTDDNGVMVRGDLVCPYRLRGFTPIQGPPARLMFEAEVDQRGFVPMEVLTSAVNESASATGRQLGDQGMGLQKFRLEPMRSFLASFVEQLRSMRQNSIKPEPFGWSFIGDKPEAFSYGGRRFNSHGDQPAAFTDRQLQTIYRRVGERPHWDTTIKFVHAQKRPSHEAILAATFGSVFFEFSGERGVLWSAVGETGTQKTTIMRISQSVWAKPQSALNSVKETTNSMTKTMGHLRTIPLLVDDVADMAQGQELLYRLGQGKDRGRLSRSAQLQETGTWSSFLITTSNHSMLAAAADMSKISPAGIYRIFEFPVEMTTTELSEEARKVLFACDHNYGIAGQEFSRWLGANAPLLPEITQEAIHKIGKELGGTPRERYWIAGIANCILAAKVTNGIHLCGFDTDTLYPFLRTSFDNLRRYIDRTGADGSHPLALISLLADFVNLDRTLVLFTDHFAPKARGQPTAVNVTRNKEIQQFKPKYLLAHVATVDQLVRIPRARFADYLKLRGWGRDQAFAEFERRLKAKRDRVALGAGTTVSMAADYVFEIDLSQSAELLELFGL